MTPEQERQLSAALDLVGQEVRRAMDKHAPMNSAHEGYGVILEELDELWDEIKVNRGTELAAFEEATQVAAMAIRYLIDLRGK